jgi:Right handed beta helix region
MAQNHHCPQFRRYAVKNIGTGSLITLTLCILAALLTQHTAVSALAPIKSGQEFVVTSAKDAGPGSLRDAILAADRLSSRAHIIIAVPRISVESALPALINPNGVEIEGKIDNATISAERLAKGAVLHITAPSSVIRGLRIIDAREVGILINAVDVRVEKSTLENSKTAVLVGSAASRCVISNTTFEGNETALNAEPGVRDMSVLTSIFRGNSRAAIWLVGAESPTTEQSRDQVRIIESVFEKNGDGVVLANRPTLIQKGQFIGSKDSAVLILGGSARIEDSEFKGSVGTALSVTTGKRVAVSRNRFEDNPATAVMSRDSDVVIDSNTFMHNGFGIVIVQGQDSQAIVRENIVSQSTSDAVTIIGGEAQLAKNQILDNHGAGLRVLDLQSAGGSRKAAPRLDGNVLKGNGIDQPPLGVYKVAAVR